MKKHNSEDFDRSQPMKDTPFFCWLKSQEDPPIKIVSALIRYYEVESRKDLGGRFKQNRFQTLELIFRHFWACRLKGFPE